MGIIFDYVQNKSWGQTGWLSSVAYRHFWSGVFADELSILFENQIVIDIGAGDGAVWEGAMEQSLRPAHLHLVEPVFEVFPSLKARGNVTHYPSMLHDIGVLQGDVAVFKQSFHHVYDCMGSAVFDVLDVRTFMNFSMPLDCGWPMSPDFRALYEPSVMDMDAVIAQMGMHVIERRDIRYPVVLDRDEWCAMIGRRFTSVLHDCSDDFIAAEIAWAQSNLPDVLEFHDTLECLVFMRDQ